MKSRSYDDDPESFDAGDSESVKSREQRAKDLEAKRLDGLKQIMSSQNGRLWMWKFLETAGLFSVVFNGNSKDYFNLGIRNGAMPHLVDIQKHFMDEYILMVRENINNV